MKRRLIYQSMLSLSLKYTVTDFECRVATTQTMVHTGTNPPRMKNYIRGLRGAPEQKMSVVQLKLDL